MANHDNPLAYTLRAYAPPRDLTIAAWLPCSQCQSTERIKISSMGNNPGLIETAFKNMGWEANVHKPRLCICPKCILKQKKEADIIKNTRKEGQVLRDIVSTNRAVEPFKMASRPVNGPLTMRDLTKEQRNLLREELDNHFDQDAGRWAEGHSDHNASETLGIPRFVVIDFRENLYGALKEDTDITWLRDALASAKKGIASLQADVSKIEDRLALVARKVGL